LRPDLKTPLLDILYSEDESFNHTVAACLAGVFSLEDGLKLIAERGRLMQALPQEGMMVAVLASEKQVLSAIAKSSCGVDSGD
jgi:acyl transferase domain-containing protein